MTPYDSYFASWSCSSDPSFHLHLCDACADLTHEYNWDWPQYHEDADKQPRLLLFEGKMYLTFFGDIHQSENFKNGDVVIYDWI